MKIFEGRKVDFVSFKAELKAEKCFLRERWEDKESQGTDRGEK